MDLRELLHKLVDAADWSSPANKAEAHDTVDAELAPAPAAKKPAKEGTPS